MQMDDVLIVIPARFASTRFPGKPLAQIHDKPMIQHVYERATQCSGGKNVVVATDDQRILDAVGAFGGRCEMTPEDMASGTDRVAWVARRYPAKIVVNLQGDEPMIPPETIDLVIDAVRQGADIGTLGTELLSMEEFENPNVVKAVISDSGSAMYFSRSPIPSGFQPGICQKNVFRHVGIYGFTFDCLDALTNLPVHPLEESEKLEQLRALAAGYDIRVMQSEFAGAGVDTPADLQQVINLFKSSGTN
jgi:3-deoxy-manno-octulosonate cytidylyltransferase (CMP-KDO synthetase)